MNTKEKNLGIESERNYLIDFWYRLIWYLSLIENKEIQKDIYVFVIDEEIDFKEKFEDIKLGDKRIVFNFITFETFSKDDKFIYKMRIVNIETSGKASCIFIF